LSEYWPEILAKLADELGRREPRDHFIVDL